jgi:hypothetical protein
VNIFLDFQNAWARFWFINELKSLKIFTIRGWYSIILERRLWIEKFLNGFVCRLSLNDNEFSNNLNKKVAPSIKFAGNLSTKMYSATFLNFCTVFYSFFLSKTQNYLFTTPKTRQKIFNHKKTLNTKLNLCNELIFFFRFCCTFLCTTKQRSVMLFFNGLKLHTKGSRDSPIAISLIFHSLILSCLAFNSTRI